jgi:hypothetical protein
MKNLLLVIAFMATSLSALAVETAKCPASITITYRSLNFSTDSQIEAQNMPVDSGTALAIAHKLQAIKSNQFSDIKLKLVGKKASQCHYLPRNSQENNGTQETRMFTSKGKNFLRVSFQTQGESFWVYHTLRSYSPHELEIEKTSGVILGGEHDGNLWVKMGWANDISLVVQ